ncbi:hypothetical protein ONZ45_g10745 [Pleurotus djamor]|nr:hypothetical protein ONZ45_g10745 [Pleurotus djamor]
MFATFTSLLPSALQLHASPEKSNGGITSDFKPDNEDDDDENIPSAGQAPVNEFGQVKDQKAKEKKAANETFIFVRPPPSKTNHPLNLQVQLVPPNTRGPTGLTPTSTTSVNSSAYGDVNTPVTATPARTSFGQGPRRQGTDESTNDLSRTSTNQSDASTAMYSSGYSSVASFSSVASTASSSSSRRTIIPLYNLQAHNVMTNTIVDAGTDAKIAKFQKRGLEMVGLALLEPVEVWPSTSTVAQQAPSTPVNSAAFAQPRSNRTSLDSRRPPHNGSGFLHAHQDKSSRPVTPTLSEDAHGHTPTSSRLSVSSAGIDSTLHHAQSQDGLHAQQQHSNHPYPSQSVSPIPEGSAVDGSSKKNIFGKLFKRKGANTNATPDLSTYSPLPSPTPMGGMSKSRPVTPKAPASPMYSASPTSPEMATTPTLASSANQFVSANQHLTVASQSHHRVPSAPVISTTAPHDRSNSETENGETPTPRNKRQAASFNLPGFMNKGSALIGRNAGGRNKPPSPTPPPLPPREHAPVSESPTIMATPPMARNGESKAWPNRSSEPSKRDSGLFGL